MHLSELTAPEAAAVETRLAVLPVGSTEQHGPHAPLGTDAIAAERVATAGVTAHDGEVVVAPTLPVGVSEEHRGFGGTLWVGPDSFRAYVGDVLESLHEQAFDRIVVVNGHGGNVDPLREVCARVTRETAARAVPFTWFDAIEMPEGLAMGHAGAVETSLLQHADPDRLRPEQIAAASADSADRWGRWAGGVNVAYDTDEFAKNGVVGDPSAATAETGEQLLEAAAGQLAALLEELETE